MDRSDLIKGQYYQAEINGVVKPVTLTDIVVKPWSTSYMVTQHDSGRLAMFEDVGKFKDRLPASYKVPPPTTPPTISGGNPIRAKASQDIALGLPSDRSVWVNCPECSTPLEFPLGKQEGIEECDECGTDVRDLVRRAWASRGGIPATPTLQPAISATAQVSAASAPMNVAAITVPTSIPAAPKLSSSPLAGKIKAGMAKVIGAAPHVIVEARAGTGKTTTLVEGMAYLRGLPTRITPSEQQAAIWEAIVLSRDVSQVGFTCFNNSIARTLEARLKERGLHQMGCEAMTMHSLGFRAVNRALGKQAPDKYHTRTIVADILGVEVKELQKRQPVLLSATEDLVSLCKQNLIGVDQGPTIEELAQLASYYEVELADDYGRSYRERVFELVPQVLEAAREPKGTITFDDMVWLPVVLDLPLFQYGLLLVDECQDLSRMQQALAKRAGKRLISVGDSKQSIYAFAGADSQSMARLEKEMAATPRGCIKLPLTVTRRCGYQIVKEAQKLVPEFYAYGWSAGGQQVALDANPKGEVAEANYPLQYSESRGWYEIPLDQTYLPLVEDGDMVLCRVNAPLVSQCFKFLKMGRRANIQGRDVGNGLISMIDKLHATSITDLIARVEKWKDEEVSKEQARTHPSESKILSIHDRAECIVCFTEGVNTIEAVKAKINSVFTDGKVCPRCKKQPAGAVADECYTCKVPLVDVKGIRLSSVHRAKGLEADRVFILMPRGAGMPHPSARSPWQVEQEYNCLYTAQTRARSLLTYVY